MSQLTDELAEALQAEVKVLRITADGYVRRSEVASILENVVRRLAPGLQAPPPPAVSGQECPPHTWPKVISGLMRRCEKCGHIEPIPAGDHNAQA